MSQPLIPSIGNALEIADVMRAFESGQGAMVEVAFELGMQLLLQAQMVLTEKGARDRLRVHFARWQRKGPVWRDGAGAGRPGRILQIAGKTILEVAPAYERAAQAARAI